MRRLGVSPEKVAKELRYSLGYLRLVFQKQKKSPKALSKIKEYLMVAAKDKIKDLVEYISEQVD